MGKEWLKSAFLCVLVFAAIFNPSLAQRLDVDTDKIESLIDEWNFANNSRNMHSFEEVYASNLMFYSERMSRSRVLQLKRQLFNQKPWFRQRIVTEITYTPVSTGVVKAEFTKEVFEKPAWKKYRSYLLVKKQGNQYAIVEESDITIDRTMKQKPVEPIPFTNEEAEQAFEDSFPVTDSSEVFSREELNSEDSAFIDHPRSASRLEIVDKIFGDLSAAGMITVPKGYVFILVGMLGLGGIMIFIADSVYSRKRRRTMVAPAHADAQPVVRSFKVQAAFEAFVVTLFDPLYFRCFRAKSESVYAGKKLQNGTTPDLIVDYNQKGTHVRFGITSQYYQQTPKSEVQLLSFERQQYIRQFEAERGLAVYYVLGFGGSPDDPRELFLIPAKEVNTEYITHEGLRRYSKSGMFYYHRRTGRIQ